MSDQNSNELPANNWNKVWYIMHPNIFVRKNVMDDSHLDGKRHLVGDNICYIVNL